MTRTNFSPECRLIFECSRTVLNGEQTRRIKTILEKPLQWNDVFQIGYRNGVLPLVSWTLLQNFADLLPAEAASRLALQNQEHTRNNLFLTAKLLEIISLLTGAGIPVLPFKGPTLAARAYGNLSLRQFVDLDILVQPKHFDEAVRHLTEIGYNPVGEVHRLKRNSLFFNSKKDIGLIDKDRRVRIELHWKLSGAHFALPLELNMLWENLEDRNLGGSQIKTLSFPDLFIYLCLHGSRHGWERLAWICDIHELLNARRKEVGEIDWDEIKHRASRYGCEKVVELGLFLVNDFFGVETTYPEWTEIKRHAAFEKIAGQVRNKIFSVTSESSDISDWYLYHLTLKEKKTDKLKLHVHYFLWYLRLVLTPNSLDRAVFNLPRVFFPLYYILRPTRLLYSYLTHGSSKEKLQM